MASVAARHASELSAAAWRVLQLDRNSMVLQDSKTNVLDLMHRIVNYSRHGKYCIFDKLQAEPGQ